MRNVFTKTLKLKKSFNPPKDECGKVKSCFIYSEKNGQGHVYYGTEEKCDHGTGSADDFNMPYVEYYTP